MQFHLFGRLAYHIYIQYLKGEIKTPAKMVETYWRFQKKTYETTTVIV
jgi:hypothetical protein